MNNQLLHAHSLLQAHSLRYAKRKPRNPHSIRYDHAVNEFVNLGIIAPPSPTKALRDAISSYVVPPYVSEGGETYVQHTDYGWSALQIAAWRQPLPESQIEISREEDLILDELFENPEVGSNWVFDDDIKYQRIYFFFLFLQFEREHRDAALGQAQRVGQLIDEPFLKTVSELFSWTEHERLEVGLALWPKEGRTA